MKLHYNKWNRLIKYQTRNFDQYLIMLIETAQELLFISRFIITNQEI